MSRAVFGTKPVLVYLKFTFNWASCTYLATRHPKRHPFERHAPQPAPFPLPPSWTLLITPCSCLGAPALFLLPLPGPASPRHCQGALPQVLMSLPKCHMFREASLTTPRTQNPCFSCCLVQSLLISSLQEGSNLYFASAAPASDWHIGDVSQVRRASVDRSALRGLALAQTGRLAGSLPERAAGITWQVGRWAQAAQRPARGERTQCPRADARGQPSPTLRTWGRGSCSCSRQFSPHLTVSSFSFSELGKPKPVHDPHQMVQSYYSGFYMSGERGPFVQAATLHFQWTLCLNLLAKSVILFKHWELQYDNKGMLYAFPRAAFNHKLGDLREMYSLSFGSQKSKTKVSSGWAGSEGSLPASGGLPTVFGVPVLLEAALVASIVVFMDAKFSEQCLAQNRCSIHIC